MARVGVVATYRADFAESMDARVPFVGKVASPDGWAHEVEEIRVLRTVGSASVEVEFWGRAGGDRTVRLFSARRRLFFDHMQGVVYVKPDSCRAVRIGTFAEVGRPVPA